MMPTKLKITLEKIISFILGVTIIVSIFWNKAIRTYLPKTIEDFNDIFMCGILYINILLSVIIIIVSFRMLLFAETSNNNGRIITYFLQCNLIKKLLNIILFVKHYIIMGPKTVYSFINIWCNLAYLFEKPFFTISHFFKELPLKYAPVITVVHIIFHSLPKIIPPIVFLVGLFTSGELTYFYKSLFLYLIPIIYNSLLWILGDLADRNTVFATAHVKFFYYNRDEFDATFQKEIPTIENAVDIISRKNDSVLLEWFVKLYETYLDIKWFVYRVELEKKHLKYYESITISSLYLIGWIFLFYKNF